MDCKWHTKTDLLLYLAKAKRQATSVLGCLKYPSNWLTVENEGSTFSKQFANTGPIP